MCGSRTQRRKRKISQPTPMPQTISPATMAANVAAASPKEKTPRAHGNDRETVEDKRCGIIRESLAFQDDKDAPGNLHSASYGEWS
jgi:hypothetical protein